ncbi:MAG TPA: hypothetical protein VGQ93_14390 [Lysobacter sp.]|nr:hypothetical protein [Lysobacter sp.]
MKPTTKWLLWAIGLLTAVFMIDLIVFIGVSTVGGIAALRAGNTMLVLLTGYTAAGIVATGIFWQLGRAWTEAGTRTAGTIAFLMLQGLALAFMSLMTLLSTHR